MEHQETPLTSKQAEKIYFNHIRGSKVLSNYIQYYDRLAKGDKEKTYEYLDESTDKLIDEKRERLNLESCAAGRAYVRGKHVAPGIDADGKDATGPAGGKGCYICGLDHRARDCPNNTGKGKRHEDCD